MPVTNILTFDVEDWYHGLDLPVERWGEFERRLGRGLAFILDALAEYCTRATFFVLGAAVCEHAPWVRRIAAAGHEIGTHGWSHVPVYRQAPAQFRAELQRSIGVLQDLTGQPVRAHRAAFFSITARSLWALGELARAGIERDSSIFPVHNYRYGLPAAPRHPHCRDEGVWEYPVSTLRVAGLNVPIGGGFYARFWPYALLRAAIHWLNRAGQPAVMYFHPWEFDRDHPRVDGAVPWLARATHGYRLGSAPGTLRALLHDFRWGAMGANPVGASMETVTGEP